MRGKIFFQNQGVRNGKKVANKWRDILKIEKSEELIMKKTNDKIERVMTERMLLHLVNLKLITKDEHEILLEKTCGGINKPVYENSA